MGKRELIALLCLSSWCIVIFVVLLLFLTAPWVGLQCVIVLFHDNTLLLFLEPSMTVHWHFNLLIPREKMTNIIFLFELSPTFEPCSFD